MRFSDTPDLTSNRRVILVALGVAVITAVVFVIGGADISKSLGDTDDAMRIVLVRDLLHGRGWYDQLVTRLQPPRGVYMHWSRLLDGVLAGCIWLLDRFTSQDWAELIVRFAWPLLWAFPAVIAGLSIARSLGGKVAVFVLALLMLTNTQAFVQFRPGRVDHHNVQITMAAIAVACAMAKVQRTKFAALAGAATGLGLAIGIEALAYHAIAGASFAISAAVDPEEDARPARAYGLALVAATVGCFVLQTPLDRWPLPFCDELGANLVGAILAAGLGLAAFATWARRAPLVGRFAVLAVIGGLAAAIYIISDPGCLRGPFGAVDPRLRPIWFDHISELQSWPKLWMQHRDSALISIFMSCMAALAAFGLLIVRWGRWDRALLLASALVAVAAVAAAHAWRMEDYAFWFGLPTLAAGIAWLAERLWRGTMVPTAAASLVLSPVLIALALNAAIGLIPPKAAAQAHLSRTAKAGPPPKAKPVQHQPGINDYCFDRRIFEPLALLPPGVVAAEIDLGPFILAHTRDFVLAAPYHRMSWGIWNDYQLLGGPTSMAQARLKALNVTYVADCRLNPLRVNPRGFEGDLRRGQLPPWMTRISPPNQLLQVYKVNPAP